MKNKKSDNKVSNSSVVLAIFLLSSFITMFGIRNQLTFLIEEYLKIYNKNIQILIIVTVLILIISIFSLIIRIINILIKNNQNTLIDKQNFEEATNIVNKCIEEGKLKFNSMGKDTIVNLVNGERYQLVEETIQNGIVYYLANKLGNNDALTDTAKIFREYQYEGKYYLDEVKDVEMLEFLSTVYAANIFTAIKEM